MKLSIIIVNYKSGPLTKNCIESIISRRLPFRTEIIVVDNASNDDSVFHLRSDFPDILVIANSTNLGLAGAVNVGLAQAKGRYLLVLNPDIIVLNQAIDKMVSFMDENPAVGMLGPKLVSPSGALQFSCYRFYRPSTIIYRRTWLGRTKSGRREVNRFLMKDYKHNQTIDVDWLMGACLMIRTATYHDIGGMDQRFFLYFEDVDWCRRAWKKGWRVTYLPDAQFSHYHQRSSEGGSILNFFTNWIFRAHIASALKYFIKYRGKELPRVISN